MHILQQKYFKLKPDEVENLVVKYNISLSQLPKISIKDPSLSEEINIGDVLKIERKKDKEIKEYFRVVV